MIMVTGVVIKTGCGTAGPQMWSEHSGAEPSQDCRDDSGLQVKLSYIPPPLTILNHTVSTVDTFRFLGTYNPQIPVAVLPHRHCSGKG